MRDRIVLWGDQLPDIRLFDDRFDRLIEWAFVSLPAQVDTSKVDARFEDGVLTVDVPKIDKATPKRIQIKAGRTKADRTKADA